jgi:uncharacterized protein DUF3592
MESSRLRFGAAAAAVGLASAYVALAVALGALSPWKHEFGILYWFLVPTVGLTCVALAIAQLVQRIAPIPWSRGRSVPPPPRRVRLSWRASVRGPALLPLLFFPWYLLSLMWGSGHRGARSVAGVLAALLLVALVFTVRKLRRETRLLRDGAAAAANIEHRTSSGEDPWEIVRYSFVTADGVVVSASAFDRGYGVRAGSTVPVFYDPQRPEDHIAACSCWLETE